MCAPGEPRLRFGVEIECVARVPSDLMDALVQRYDRGPKTNRQVLTYHLSEILGKAGIPCHRYDISYSLKNKKNTYAQWAFDVDFSIIADAFPFIAGINPDSYYHYGLELISRRLPLNDLDYTPGTASSMNSKSAQDSIAEIGHVLGVLKTSGILLLKNESCGLHVHVGLEPQAPATRSPPFRTDFLLAFAALVTSLEPCINSLLAPARMFSTHCEPPSKFFGSAGMAASLARIQTQTTTLQIIETMNPGFRRRYAYNFQNMVANAKRPEPINTIEFRQHQGTLDFGEIKAWVQVVAGVVRRAFQEGVKERCEGLVGDVEGGRFTFVEFLGEVGKGHLVPFYKGKVDLEYSPI